jgi:hypothetical protein
LSELDFELTFDFEIEETKPDDGKDPASKALGKKVAAKYFWKTS